MLSNKKLVVAKHFVLEFRLSLPAIPAAEQCRLLFNTYVFFLDKPSACLSSPTYFTPKQPLPAVLLTRTNVVSAVLHAM